MMSELLRTARGALLLDEETFVKFKTSHNVFARGVLLIVVVSLIVGLVGSVVQLVGGLTALPFSVQRQSIEQEISRAFRSMPGMDVDMEMLEEIILDWTSIGLELEEIILDWTSIGLDIAESINQLPTPLPRPAGNILRAIGSTVSAPLLRLSGWMFFTLIVFGVAKLMGGRATVQEMLGTTALYIIPHIAGILNPITCLRTLAWVVATVWGIVIYVRATAVANEIDNGRAALAVFLPVLVPVFLLMVIFTIGVLVALTGQ